MKPLKLSVFVQNLKLPYTSLPLPTSWAYPNKLNKSTKQKNAKFSSDPNVYQRGKAELRHLNQLHVCHLLYL